MRKREVRIENWAVIQSSRCPCFEDFQPGFRLIGNVVGHANLLDQSFIYTSRIVSVDSVNGVVETQNTLYRLGQPDETYRAWQLEGTDSKSYAAVDLTSKVRHPRKNAA